MLARLPAPDAQTIILVSMARVFLRRELGRRARRAFMVDVSALVAASGSAEAAALWRLVKEAVERDTA